MPRVFAPEFEDWLLDEVRVRVVAGEGHPAALSRALHALAPEDAEFEPFDRLVSRLLHRLRTAGEVRYSTKDRAWRSTPLGLDVARAKCQLRAPDSRKADP
jgi:hypothetical protein